jgi:hypothetical protein
MPLNWKQNYWVKRDMDLEHFQDIEYRADDEYFITSILYDNDTMITFWRKVDLPEFWGTGVYIGSNYVVGSTKSSRSYNYHRWVGMPNKYLKTAERLREASILKWV